MRGEGNGRGAECGGAGEFGERAAGELVGHWDCLTTGEGVFGRRSDGRENVKIKAADRNLQTFLNAHPSIASLLLDKSSMGAFCSGLSSPRLPSLVEWLNAGVALT
jgi:hypothetical protein